MRVTEDTYYRHYTSSLFALQHKQALAREQIDTGHKVNRPSDEPSYAGTIMTTQLLEQHNDQYRINLDAALNWLVGSEDNMAAIEETLQRAKELAEQMATGTVDSLEYTTAASEVQNLYEELLVLTNSQIEGDYIFSGTRTDTPAVSDVLQAHNPAELYTDSSTGHGTVASFYQDPDTGEYYLQLTRDEVGRDASVSFPVDNTLGDSTPVPSWSFDASDWDATTYPGDDRAGIYQLLRGMTSQTSVISAQAGEEMTWISDADQGNHTYRTSATLTITGACNVELSDGVFTDTFLGVTDAQDLVNRIAENDTSNYFGYVDPDDPTVVHIISTGAGSFDITEPGVPSGNLTIDQDTTASELVAQINAGLKAQGVLQIDGDHAGFPPAMTDTVTLDGNTWTWDQITGGTTLPDAGSYATALADWINDHTMAYSATTLTSGNDGVVQVQARAAGSAGNVTLAVSGTTVTSASGQLFGGLEGTDTSTQGVLYATGESTLRLSTTIRCTVMDVDGNDVTVRAQWFDDDGVMHEEDLVLSDDGEDQAQLITGTGLSLYRDDQDYYEGAVFDLAVGHYRGNDEDMAVNFASGGTLDFNWTAEELLGTTYTQTIFGEEAKAKAAATTASVFFEGVYQGMSDRTINIDVVEGGTLPTDNRVVFRVTYTDDDGQEVQETIALTGTGRENGAVIPLNGGTSVDLTGEEATATVADPDARLFMAGTYTGLTSRDLDFQVTAVTANTVTVDVTWLDDQGVSQTESLDFAEFGEDHAQTIPGCDGVEFYLNGSSTVANYQVGDSFTYDLELYPDNAGGGIFFYVDNETFNTGDSFYYEIDQEPVGVLDLLVEWRYQLLNGTSEEAQTQSQITLEALGEAMAELVNYQADSGTRQERVAVRQQVLEDYDLYAAEVLDELRDVELTEVFLNLQADLTAYQTSLQTISTVQELFLADMI